MEAKINYSTQQSPLTTINSKSPQKVGFFRSGDLLWGDNMYIYKSDFMKKLKQIKNLFSLVIVICTLFFSSCAQRIDVRGNENSESISYNGIEYSAHCFYCSDNNRKHLGYIENGASVFSIGNSETPKYIEIVGSDNSGCFVASGSSIPSVGTITSALIDPSIRGENSTILSTEGELEILKKLSRLTETVQRLTIDNYYTDGNAFYYVYDNCGVSCKENFGGYIAYTSDKWVYSASDSDYEWGKNNSVSISAIIIEDEELIDEMCKTNLVKYIECK